MAEFKSHYLELGFYVNGELKKFSGGRYAADNQEEIAVLESIIDAVKVEVEAVVEPVVEKAVESKPKVTRTSKRK